MMRSSLWLCLFLVACAGAGNSPISSAQKNAELVARAAVESGRMRHWDESAASWRDALSQYQSIDDWQGQGRARLGLSSVLLHLNEQAEAEAILLPLIQYDAFGSAQRAQAAYQLALHKQADNDVALSWLGRARAWCQSGCNLNARLDNLAASLVARQADWPEVARLANRALLASHGEPAEEAHARRLLAEVALINRDWLLSRKYLDQALVLDRTMGEPQWLLDDYALLMRLARASNDTALARDVLLRQQSICAGLSEQKCGIP